MVSKFHQWRIGTINIRTGKEDEKLQRAVHQIHKAGLSVCGLQEVRRLNNGSAVIESEIDDHKARYELFWSGYVHKRLHGVGIAVKVDKNIEIIEIIPVNARIIVADVIVFGCSIRVINCYAPTEDASEATKNAFYQTLNKYFKVCEPQKVLCLGDFNATTSAAWFNSSLRENVVIENLKVNDNGERFHNLVNVQSLSVLNTWFTHRDCRRVTWHSPDRVTKKIYDFILVCSWLRRYATNCRVYNSYDFDSDHRLVVASLNTPMNKVARHITRSRKKTKKIDFGPLSDPVIESSFLKCAVDEIVQCNVLNADKSNSTINTEFVKAINSAADKVLPKKEHAEVRQPWQDDEMLRNFYAEKDELLSRNADLNSIRSIRRKIRMRSSHLRNEFFAAEAERINQLAINRQLEKLFQQARNQETTLKPVSSFCPPDKILEHFKAHFNPDNPSVNSSPEELSSNIPDFINHLRSISKEVLINNEPPTIEEIEKRLKEMKSNKASNDVDPNLIKCCDHPIMLQVIQRMTDKLWENLDIAEAWGNSRLKTIWKGKGSQKDPSKYRGISIGSTVCKLIVNIILQRLRPWYERQLTDEQNGFRKSRGTTDGIYTAKRVQQISHKKKQPLFLLFVDLTAAFDHVPRNWLFQSLKLRFPSNQPSRLIEILEHLYKNTTLTYDDADTTFQTTSGVRQGGPESPFLFTLYADFVMRVFLDRCEKDGSISFFHHKYRLNARTVSREERLAMRQNNSKLFGEETLPWCGYADDLILFLLDCRGLQNATTLLDEVFHIFGLTVNELKTETMILNPTQLESSVYPDSIVSLRNTALRNVSDFKYLGSVLCSEEPNTGDTELNNRIQMANAKFAQLSNLLQNNKILLRIRVKFLNCFVRSRLTYACQTWNLTSAQYERLDACYRLFLRRMVRGGFQRADGSDNFRFKFTNDDIHSLCGSSDLNVFIKQQQRSYASHIVRMSRERSVKKLMFNVDKCLRPGRMSKSLLDQVVVNDNTTIDGFCNAAMCRK